MQQPVERMSDIRSKEGLRGWYDLYPWNDSGKLDNFMATVAKGSLKLNHRHLQELANFENSPDGPKLCVDDLLRDGGFLSCGFQPRYQAFIAEAVFNGGIR